MPKAIHRTLEDLVRILDEGGLLLAEEFCENERYPKSRYVLTECKTCHVFSHYKIGYIIDKTPGFVEDGYPVCRACYWKQWYESNEESFKNNDLTHLLSNIPGSSFLSKYFTSDDEVKEPMALSYASDYVQQYGYELVDLINTENPGCELFVVRCLRCGKQTVQRKGDLSFGCSCQSHSKTSIRYKPSESHLLRDSKEDCLEWWDHELNSEELFNNAKAKSRSVVNWKCPECGTIFEEKVYKMTSPNSPKCPRCTSAYLKEFNADIEKYSRIPVSDVPELLSQWDDERDPSTVMVYSRSWSGMCPGDGLCRFKCPNGHHPQAFPYTYLTQGCPFCKAAETRDKDAGYLLDENPELSQEWLYSKNGYWTPENVRPKSKRTVWWKCIACGHIWQETPKDRLSVRSQGCPECGKILGSLAWIFPKLANEWSPENPLSPWEVRPHANLQFKPIWVCSNNDNHTWQASLASRVNGSGCPECRESGKSQVEINYFKAALKLFGTSRSGLQIDSPSMEHPWLVDIFVPYRTLNVVVEYDGEYWHKDKQDVDTRKSRELLDEGYYVIRLREDRLDSLAIKDSKYLEIKVLSQAQRPSETMQEIKDFLDKELEESVLDK